jgi:hypothetical protein
VDTPSRVDHSIAAVRRYRQLARALADENELTT